MNNQGRRSFTQRSILFLFMTLSVLLFAVPSVEAAAGIKISGSEYVAKGKSVWLTADQDVTWKSSKPSVAKVSKRGKVKGRRAGTAVITAISKKNKSVKARIKIKVKKKAVKKIQLSMSSISLDVTRKPSVVLSASASPAKAAQVFSFTSNAPWVAEVAQNGVVTARRAGNAVITCSSVDGSNKSVSIPVTVTDEELKKREAAAREAAYCNILLIGNSFTQDEFGYVPALLKEFFPQQKFRVGLLYTGGASLGLHYTNLTSPGNKYVTYSEYTSESSRWAHRSGVSLSDVIKKYAWKIVTLQQASGLQGDYSSMEPYIGKLLSGYAQKMGRQPVFLYVFPHVRGSRNSLISPGTTADAFAKYVPIVQKVAGAFRFTAVIPNAAAIENARKTSLNSLGNGGDLTSDSTHLQDGLPCLVANYCSFLKLLPYIGKYQADLTKSRILPTKEWIAAQSIPGADGQSTGVTEANRLLAARCAIAAVRSPYTISTIQ